MYSDALEYANNYPHRQGAERQQKPPLHQIVRVDIMELPITSRGNCYVCDCVVYEMVNGFPTIIIRLKIKQKYE